MSLAQPLALPFYTGGSVSSQVPGKYPMAIAGRPFQLDGPTPIRSRPIPVIREQVDTSAAPGEHSINPLGLWRSPRSDWSRGAGQEYFDRPDSDAARFRSSKGVDPWRKWGIELLHDVLLARESIATNVACAVAGAYLYAADGNEVHWTQDPFTEPVAWTAAGIQAGDLAQSVKSVTSDGKTLYAALGSNGIHTTTRGDTTSSHFSDLSCTLVAYVKGRLMAANGSAIYNVIASGPAPSALLTHPNADFRWVGFAAGRGHIYAAGFSGDKSLVYRTAVQPDGTGLEVPVVAGELPDGEVVRSIYGYVGAVLLLGTDKGARLCLSDDNGDLTIGEVIETPHPVRCFEGQERFVWFGMTNHDGDSTGLGRLDLTVDTGEADVPTPGWASDLMATGQGDVASVVTFGGRRLFAVAGLGVYAESDELVSEGHLDSGLIGFGIPELKVALFVDVRHDKLAGSHAAWLAADHGDFVRVGVHATPGSTSPGNLFPAGQRTAELFELREQLVRSSSDPTTGPRITRDTLFVNPVANSGLQIEARLRLAKQLKVGAQTVVRDPDDDLAFLERLRRSRTPVILQRGRRREEVTIEGIDWDATEPNDDGTWNGVATTRMKTVEV